MVPFYGWRMPLYFSGSRKEHLSVRKASGVFDVSHMGEIRLKGPLALKTLSRLLVSNVSALKKNQCQYSLLCNREGGILDDLIVYCFEPQTDYLLCVNCSRSLFHRNWIKKHAPGEGVSVEDESLKWSQLAVQGPFAPDLTSQILKTNKLLSLKRFRFQRVNFENSTLVVSATGYTGEKGFEILSPLPVTLSLWKKIRKAGIPPCGLAARDTLRMEMKYPLYGQDLGPDINPHAAGLSRMITNPHPFIGKEALLKKHFSTLWVGFQLKETQNGVPRYGQVVFSKNQQKIGTVTSGAYSPSSESMLGMAHIHKDFCTPGQKILVEIHKTQSLAEVVATPFINR